MAEVVVVVVVEEEEIQQSCYGSANRVDAME